MNNVAQTRSTTNRYPLRYAAALLRLVLKQPVFLVGTGRTGSSYLRFILDQHPSVVLTNEANIFALLQRAHLDAQTPLSEHGVAGFGLVAPPYVSLLSEIFFNKARLIVEEFYGTLYADREFTHWGDKLPTHGSVPFIQRMYPEARYVLLIRDPRDVVCSHRAYGRRLETRPAYLDYAVREMSESWNRLYDYLLAILNDYHLVRYEDLIHRPEKVVEDVLSFLDLEYHSSCRCAVRAEHVFSDHTTSLSPQESVGRWRRELDTEEVAACEQVCKALMMRFGYPSSDES